MRENVGQVVYKKSLKLPLIFAAKYFVFVFVYKKKSGLQTENAIESSWESLSSR